MTSFPEGENAISPARLAKRLGLPFTNLHLLTRALTHRSFINEHPDALEDNERLEFLGDAVLDFVVAAWLFSHFPEMAEGELTQMRSALVRTEELANFARQMDLGATMRLGRGEIQAGGREREALLCATFEAVIGALFLQTNIEAVQRFVYPYLEQAVTQLVFQPDIHDSKSRLQEWSQAQKYGVPRYTTIQASGPEHDKLFVVEVEINDQVYGRGSGHSKQVAARAAAQAALERIEGKQESK